MSVYMRCVALVYIQDVCISVVEPLTFPIAIDNPQQCVASDSSTEVIQEQSGFLFSPIKVLTVVQPSRDMDSAFIIYR